jgi:iron complex outermembrane recepter protein
MSHKFPLSLLSIAVAQALCLQSAQAQTSPSAEPTTQKVVLTGKADKAKVASVGGFGEAPLLDTPLSITTFDQEKIQNLAIRQTSDAVKFDASVNDSYNAVGYAEQFSIRGFALDNASAYRKDGFAIPGDASIPLENKERIEILKGIAGFQAGFATPGGVINYITKRPTNAALRSVSTGISERGTAFISADLGGQFDNTQFAYRINAATERLRSYVKGADGQRQFASAAFDWRISPDALLQVDGDFQHKSQISAPGYQLTDGIKLPSNVPVDILLGKQSWTKPVDTRNSNLGLRFEYQLAKNWSATFAANKHEFKRDDFSAFPYGCTFGSDYIDAGYCANGDYDVYDYQSANESKSVFGTQALLNGKLNIAGVQHQLTFGISTSKRRDYAADPDTENADPEDQVFSWVGTSNIYSPIALDQARDGNGVPLRTGLVSLRRTDIENSVFAQDIIDLNSQWQLHVGVRRVHINRSQTGVAGYVRNHFLPSAAIVFKPVETWSIFSSFTRGIEHGGVPDKYSTNKGLTLDPARSKQVELGSKYDVSSNLNVSAAIFAAQKPFEYYQTNADESRTYVRQGDAKHTGLELNAEGKLDKQISIGASLTTLNARQTGTNDPALEDKRVTNVPKTKATVYGDYALQRDLHLNATWLYASSKAFSPDNKVAVPGYNVYNLGARYDTKLGSTHATLRFNVDNVTNKFYWRDVTQSLGGYLFAGAPRLYKLSAQFDF